MQRIRGIGGVFFKSRDPKALAAWYARALGVPIEPWNGAAFGWSKLDPSNDAATVWAPFAEDTTYFGDSGKPFMINYCVDDLDAMLAQIREAGGVVDPKITDEANGRFGWATDPEGNRFELWQPVAEKATPEAP